MRLGEVEPVFGQTGRVVLDITARTAHDGALKWTRAPSTPRAARSIFATFPSTCALPSGGRWSLRRVLQRPGRQRKRSSAKSSWRAIADEFFGALLTPVLQRAVRSAAVGDAASALVRHLPRRMRSDGLETVNVRTSRGTTVPVTTPYYREKHARRAKRRPGLYPALVVLGIYDRCTPKLASDASRAVAMLSSLAEAQAQLRSEGIALDIKTLRSTAYSLRCAGPSSPAERGVRSAGPRDREAGGRLPRRGPRPCEAQEAWPQDEEGAQPIPYRLKGTEAPHPVRRRRRRATVSDVGPDHRRHAPGTGGGLRPAVVVRAADRPQRR